MNTPTGIEAAVCADIAARQRKGLAKYRMTVADNPADLREWLTHAYEESLDKSVYLRRAIEELHELDRIHRVAATLLKIQRDRLSTNPNEAAIILIGMIDEVLAKIDRPEKEKR